MMQKFFDLSESDGQSFGEQLSSRQVTPEGVGGLLAENRVCIKAPVKEAINRALNMSIIAARPFVSPPYTQPSLFD